MKRVQLLIFHDDFSWYMSCLIKPGQQVNINIAWTFFCLVFFTVLGNACQDDCLVSEWLKNNWLKGKKNPYLNNPPYKIPE